MLSRFLVITLSLSSMAAFASVRAVVVSPDVTARAPAVGPQGDYGDAPDGSLAGYDEPFQSVIGKFPTLFMTSNSRLGRPGAHALRLGQEMLGLNVSQEADAADLDDHDGTSNLVDQDRFDDSLRVATDPMDQDTPRTINIVVSVAATAPNVPRFVNVVIDLNHDGMWQKVGDTDEWIVKNRLVTLAPGTSGVAAEIPFSLVEAASPTWMRVALTRAPIPESDFAAVGGWDGSGQFEYGEIEDHFLPVAKAIASAFAAARAAASACARCDVLVASLSQALATAQANANAAAAALAQAQAHASAAAGASASAQVSVSAAASAFASAQAFASAALSVIIAIPCIAVQANLRAVVEAFVKCAADARAQAEAHASAAARARAEADARAQAAAAARADADAAAASLAQAHAAARARAEACARAVAEARAAAQAAALAIALGGPLAYAAAVARAAAAASAWASAQAHCQAIAAAFADAQAFAIASARAIAIAQAAVLAAAYAAAVAQAAASAAGDAAASADASANATASVRASVTALIDPSCKEQFCQRRVSREIRLAPDQSFTLAPPHELARLAEYGLIQFGWEQDVPPVNLMLDQRTGVLSGYARSLGPQPHPLTIVARDNDGCELARYTFTIIVEGEDIAKK